MSLVCAQRHRDHYPVQGSARKPYTVRMFRPNELPSCTCTGFMTKRNKNANQIGGGFVGAGAGLAKTTAAWCKHLKQIKETTCDWMQQPGQQRQLQCPQCGGPVVDSASPRLAPGLGPVTPSAVPAQRTPATKPRRVVTKKAAPPALPDPKVLIQMARELQAQSDADDSQPAPAPTPSGNSMFEKITGKSGGQPKSKPKSTDATTAAAQLAALLKDA